jgi:phosphate transport system ATP-binding protein
VNEIEPTFTIRDLNFYYGQKLALREISMDILPQKVTALIGPSGCGKAPSCDA